MHMVAEGVKSSPSVLELATRSGVEMPLTDTVVRVCQDGWTAQQALLYLMQRDPKAEIAPTRR